MPNKIDKPLIIPKHKAIAVPSGITLQEWLNFACIIHANNLGMNGMMVTAKSEIMDTGDCFVIGFECVKYEDVKQDVESQQRLQELATLDIEQFLKFKV